MNENDPRTSFQAGEPAQLGEPFPKTEPIDVPLSIAANSKLDRAVGAVKLYERWGLAAGVGLQLLVLLAMIVMGTFKALRQGF